LRFNGLLIIGRRQLFGLANLNLQGDTVAQFVFISDGQSHIVKASVAKLDGAAQS
jgi:hypothetical protein